MSPDKHKSKNQFDHKGEPIVKTLNCVDSFYEKLLNNVSPISGQPIYKPLKSRRAVRKRGTRRFK